jgi:hypothetical protein
MGMFLSLSSLIKLLTFIVTAQGEAPVAPAQNQCEGPDCLPSTQPSTESTQAALKKVEASIAARIKERSAGSSKWGKHSGLSWHEVPEDNYRESEAQRRNDRYYAIARDQQKYSRNWGMAEDIQDDPNNSNQDFSPKAEGQSANAWMSKTTKYQRRAEILGEASAEIRKIQQKYLAKLIDLEETSGQEKGQEQNDRSRSESERKSWGPEEQRKSMDDYYRRQDEKFKREVKKRMQERYRRAKEFTSEDLGKEVGGEKTTSQRSKNWGRRLDQKKKQKREQWKERVWTDTWREEGDQSPSSASTYTAHTEQSTVAPPSESTLRRLFKAVNAAISLQPAQYYHASNDYPEKSQQRMRRKTRLFAY